jgi:hypothetical protein
MPLTGMAGTRTGHSDAQLLRDAMLSTLKSGDAHEDGHVTIDGRDAIRIVAGDTVLIVDARTSQPIEWRNVGEHPHAVITTRIEIYEHLPATRGNRALLSVTAQHPDAKPDPGGITIEPDPPGKDEPAARTK